MEVEYVATGPSMAYFFDRRPEPAAPEQAAGPSAETGQKRKLVHLDGYDIDTADGNFHARKRPMPALPRSVRLMRGACAVASMLQAAEAWLLCQMPSSHLFC